MASNQTWTANTSPHVVTTNIVVPLGVTLTVSPCAEVRIRPGFDITVQGTLIARGTALQRITIRRDNPALPFDSLWVKSTGFLELAYVDLSGGGAGGAQGASVIAEGNDGLPPVLPLLVDHLRVVGSTSYGLKLFHRAGFAPGSRDLVVQGSGATDPNSPFPVRMSLNTVGTLPTGSYTGNASDLIQVVGEGGQAVEVDDTFHDRGVPYHVGGTLGEFGIIVVHSNSSLPTLTIDAGVEIRFFSSGSNIGGLFVGSGSPNSTGRIVANGTALAPVVFTGAGRRALGGELGGHHLLRRSRRGQRARPRPNKCRGPQWRRRRLRLPSGGRLRGDLGRAQNLRAAELPVPDQLDHLELEHARRVPGLGGRPGGLPRRQHVHQRRLLQSGASQVARRFVPAQSDVFLVRSQPLASAGAGTAADSIRTRRASRRA